MSRTVFSRTFALATTAAWLLSGCSAIQPSMGLPAAVPQARPLEPARTASACTPQWKVISAVDVATAFGDFNSLNATAGLSTTDRWAVGQFHRFSGGSYDKTLTEHWNGSKWKVIPSRNSRRPVDVLNGAAAISSNDVWAVGYDRTAAGNYHTLMEHWDGSSWSVSPIDHVGYLTSVAAASSNDAWAVGSTNYVGRGLLEHWNGTTWTATRLPDTAFLRSVTVVAPNDVWAVGQLSINPSAGDLTFAVHYNGHRWVQVPTPSPLQGRPSDQNWLTSVTPISPNDVWATGVERDTDYGVLDQIFTLHWDGRRWSLKRAPNPGGKSAYNDLWGAAASNGAVWAVGSVGTATFKPISEDWNGSRWGIVATPALQGVLLALSAAPGTSQLWGTGNQVHGSGSTAYTGVLAERICPL
jgi:hypothetical protein